MERASKLLFQRCSIALVLLLPFVCLRGRFGVCGFTVLTVFMADAVKLFVFIAFVYIMILSRGCYSVLFFAFFS